MDFYLLSALSLAIVPAAVAGLVRRKKLDESFAPILWLLWMGALNEVLSIFFAEWLQNNYHNYNLFLLMEMALLFTFFKRQGVFDQRPWLYAGLLAVFSSFWIAELFITPLERFHSYCLVLFSFVVALLSVQFLSRLIFMENHSLLRNANFLFCLGFLMNALCAIVVEVFTLNGLERSTIYQLYIHRFFVFSNVFANLIYLFAVLWIPLKVRLLLQPST